ncbi:MAG: cell division protein FtsZ [Elusimicrobia bacterium]|nr:cell division protein FtsZ [Elusimicrobiota bacterium]
MTARIQCVDDFKELRAVIKVAGLGGAGGNAINRMCEAGVRDVDLIAANTDSQVLRHNKAPLRIQMGEKLTKGLGVGGDPAKGRLAALESKESLREALSGADLIFITAGMGGGTGTGSAPVVAELARELNALTIGVVSRPFEFEGKIRALQAEAGIKEMRKHVDTLLVISNDSLFDVIEENTPSAEAFRKADDVLRQAIQSIADVITTPGLINVDLNDIKAIMAGAGEAHMGIGEGSGSQRTMEAAKQAIHSPLLDNLSIEGAKGMIVNIVGDRKLTLAEIQQAVDFIKHKASPEANIKFGQAFDDSMGGQVRVTVIATGFPAKRGRGASREAAAAHLAALPAGGRLSSSPWSLDPGAVSEKPEGAAPDDWAKPAFLHWKVRKLQ